MSEYAYMYAEHVYNYLHIYKCEQKADLLLNSSAAQTITFGCNVMIRTFQ